jgi:hypothetical protein
MHRDEFAEDIVIADLDAGGLALVVVVLGLLTQDGMAMDGVVASHGQRAEKMDAGSDDTAGTNLDRTVNDHIGTDLHVVGKLGTGVDDGTGMDTGAIRDRHDYTRAG